MPFELTLPPKFRQARWKAKIREKETREPPHVTLLRETLAWRINLRTGEFMDSEPEPSDVPKDLVKFIKGQQVWRQLCQQWDRKYPQNLVRGEKEPGDEHDKDANN